MWNEQLLAGDQVSDFKTDCLEWERSVQWVEKAL